MRGELSFPSGAAADSPKSGFPGLRAGLNRAAAVVAGTGWEWWRQCPVSGKVSIKIQHLQLPPDICESGYPVFPAVLQERRSPDLYQGRSLGLIIASLPLVLNSHSLLSIWHCGLSWLCLRVSWADRRRATDTREPDPCRRV